jgi:uncharacterized protein
MPPNEKLRPFVRLQEIDLERHRLRKAVESAEAKKEEPRKKLAAAKAAAAAAEAQKAAKEAKLQDAQLRLKLDEEKIQKLEKQLLTLSSGKEYKTMEHQIRGKKADKSLIEDEILQLMEDADAARVSAAAGKEAFAKAEHDAHAVETAVETATREQVARLKVLDGEAAGAEALCERDLLAQYQKLLGRRAGVALAAVVNRICQGCYTSITPHEENQLVGGQVLNCSNCQRFIYLP